MASRPVHPVYASIEDRECDLEQGDILQPTAGLQDILGRFHHHFINEKYSGFLVLTQTCDLVRGRGDPCKARYINLAVIRPLGDVLHDLLQTTCQTIQLADGRVPGLYSLETRDKAQLLLERICNQNAQTEGVFYLHADAGVGIAVSSVALLQVSIAVHAKEHYEALVQARSGRIKRQFQNKLGWLVGHLFSRVATEDWNRREMRQHIKQVLGDILWVSQKEATLAEETGIVSAGLAAEDVYKAIKGSRLPLPKERAAARVGVVVKDVIPRISDPDIRRIRSRLLSDAEFSASCKPPPGA
ncbi:hypothetical protein LCGC14_0204710 [marine sediment metagenome]|uniref:Uncharacterized protein n=1 Tax=marine sediment metagenome TaxID=412755 RepID=A0A0F9XKU3_9ZZZZ|nr:hypothetical protein [Phycisphaerae bacterium]HDZ45317.1 hypothetical protein [Phycisphaerae bacterium]